MIRQPFAREADRVAYAKWARAVALVYGGLALILIGLVVLGQPLGMVAPERKADRAVASAVSAVRETAQPAACRDRRDITCAGVPAGE